MTTLKPESRIPAANPISLGIFGMAIGLLAALSTAAGTTSTLIGLLFALIGGSFLTWLDKEKVDESKLPILHLYSGNFSLGLILGLILLLYPNTTETQPT